MVVFKRPAFGDSWIAEVEPWYLILCHDAVERHVEIPRGLMTIMAVFSKKKPPHKQYWKICEPRGAGFYMPFVGVNERLSRQTAQFVSWLHGNGIRYVWIEY